MRGKKWLLTVVCALLLVGVVCVLGNWLIDPFGVFEASPLQWDSYAQTLNPRGSKVRYISERPGEYDSFVVRIVLCRILSAGNVGAVLRRQLL